MATLQATPAPSEERQLQLLERAEKGIDDWGRKLANMQPTETWTTSNTGCLAGDAVLSAPVTCGERQNAPTCPIT